MAEIDSKTLSADALTHWMEAHPQREVLALMIVWSADEPERVGEVLLVRPLRGGKSWLLGRGEARPDDPWPRLLPARQRPGHTEQCLPLRSRHISRDQLHLRADGDDSLLVTRSGRCPLIVGDDEVEEATLTPGDMIELKNSLLLYCTRRPTDIPAWAGSGELPPFTFGEADPWGLVGECPATWDLRERLGFIARRSDHVLITGESGTGKELAASAIHRQSVRAGRPLVARSAATIPESLIDAELFGNARDYPNPGMKERQGLIGEANGSTLFLDEFGELSHELQAHLLRVLDQGEYQRLGEARMRTSDFRLVAATNRPEAHLKHDMLARLRLRLQLPDLNQRREDVPLIVRHLLRRIARQDQEVAGRFFHPGDATGEPRLTPGLARALFLHRYATHVRELEALLWQGMTASKGGWIDLQPEMLLASASPEERARRTDVDPLSVPPEEIQACLDRNDGMQEKAWRELGFQNRHVLARLVKKYGLSIRRTRPQGFARLDGGQDTKT